MNIEDKEVRQAFENLAKAETSLKEKQEEAEKLFPTILPNGIEINASILEKGGKISTERKFISQTIQSWLKKYDWEGNYDILYELIELKATYYRLSQVSIINVTAYIEAQKQKVIVNKAISDREKQIGMSLGQMKENKEEKLNVIQKVNEICQQTQEYIVEHLTKVEICPQCGAVLLGIPITGIILHPFMKHITDRVWSEHVQKLVERGVLTIFQGAEILEMSPQGFIREAKRRNCSKDIVLKLETQLKDRVENR